MALSFGLVVDVGLMIEALERGGRGPHELSGSTIGDRSCPSSRSEATRYGWAVIATIVISFAPGP